MTTAASCNDFVVTTLPHGNLDPANIQVSLQGKRQLFSPRIDRFAAPISSDLIRYKIGLNT